MSGEDFIAAPAEDEADELYEHFSLTADPGQSPLRVDRWLADRLRGSSRTRIQAAAEAGCILVGGKPVKASYRVRPSDRVSVVLPYPRRETELAAEDIPLDIVYEDSELLVVDKPAGMVVHPGHGNWSGTLVNALLWHLKDEPGPVPEGGRAGLVHRIDKDTSGLLVVAKTERANASLARQFFEHTVRRRYAALVWGSFDAAEGTVEGNIGRSLRDRKSMAVYPDGSAGKRAVTHWRTLRDFGYTTLVECRLETGRTHQIRVHMAHIGHPLAGDARYGGDRILRGTTSGSYRRFAENCLAAMPRQALHARSLGFVHPSTGEEMDFESPLPADFAEVLSKWENYTAARTAGKDTQL